MKKKKQRSGKKLLANFIGITLICLFLVMLVINISIIATSYFNPSKAPSLFGVTPMVVQSGSMTTKDSESIQVGDLILIKNIDSQAARQLSKNEIITYKQESAYITHRIVDIKKQKDAVYYITKGDANNISDELPVKSSQILGKYIKRIPMLGKLVLFVQTPFGVLLSMGIPIGLFLIYELIRKAFYYRKHKVLI